MQLYRASGLRFIMHDDLASILAVCNLSREIEDPVAKGSVNPGYRSLEMILVRMMGLKSRKKLVRKLLTFNALLVLHIKESWCSFLVIIGVMVLP